MLEINQIHHGDCLELMKDIPDNSIDMVLTDIPYNEVNRGSNGLRNLDKGIADILSFDLSVFLTAIDRITKSTIIIFCGNEQYSTVYEYFSHKKTGTVRQLIWAKTNPSPMNGEYIYLSGTENAVWFKNRGGTFNAHCKKNVFSYPCGRSKLHPTEKNHSLLEDLISDNTNKDDLILDPCCGSGSHLYVALNHNRNFIGIEKEKKYVDIANQRIKNAEPELF